MDVNRILKVFRLSNLASDSEVYICNCWEYFCERGGTRILDPMIKSHGGQGGNGSYRLTDAWPSQDLRAKRDSKLMYLTARITSFVRFPCR